jgi:RNA polymerase sigma factor (sigma-70 family)
MQQLPCVYIVDDEASIRDSLALWLGMRGHRTHGFESAEAFLATLRPDMRGCAIIDLRLSGMDGLQLQERMKAMGSALPVIFVTGHGDVSTARDALKAGAFDFIEKPVDNDRLVELVEAALTDDEHHASQDARLQQLHDRLQRLTDRERQVMELVVAGRHNREIAAELGISPRTVEVYKARLMDKLDVRRVPDLVKLALSTQNAASSEP